MLDGISADTDSFQARIDLVETVDLVHLLLCTNNLYLQHAGVCLTSLLANNPCLQFNIVLVRRASETLDEEKLRQSLAHFSNFSLTIREFTPPAHPPLPLNPNACYTFDNWTRLWVEEFFPNDVERVLYLDSDIVVTGSVAELWHADLDGFLLGAVDIPGSQKGLTELKLRAEDGYFNSWVLLIDLKQWRETRALDTLIKHIETYPETLTDDLDQDALNACFYDRRKRLDDQWNATWTFYREQVSTPVSSWHVEFVREEARIIHFNGSSKPWSYFCAHPRKAEYFKYLGLTEWRDFVPKDRTLINIARKHISAILPARAKSLLKAACCWGLEMWKPSQPRSVWHRSNRTRPAQPAAPPW